MHATLLHSSTVERFTLWQTPQCCPFTNEAVLVLPIRMLALARCKCITSQVPCHLKHVCVRAQVLKVPDLQQFVFASELITPQSFAAYAADQDPSNTANQRDQELDPKARRALEQKAERKASIRCVANAVHTCTQLTHELAQATQVSLCILSASVRIMPLLSCAVVHAKTMCTEGDKLVHMCTVEVCGLGALLHASPDNLL